MRISDWRSDVCSSDLRPALRLRSPVNILEAHDVVLAQVIARLHFDQFEWAIADVFQTMLHPDRDVRGLVGTQHQQVLATGDAGAAIDHHPMLGAVMMQLQAERSTGLDADALDLKPCAAVYRIVATPRATIGRAPV